MALLGLFLIPLFVTVVAFFTTQGRVTWKEALLQLGVGCLVLAGAYELAKWGAMRDTEHLNGRITGKPSGTQSCCHCRTVCDSRDKKGNCTSSHEVCSHFHDYWWSLDTTVGSISVESCSGWDSAPDVWTKARIGEPAVVDHSYDNYLKADPNSLFDRNAEALTRRFTGIPKYPALYSEYKVDHVVADGQAVPAAWQDEMRELNADLGASNQVDVTMLLTSNPEPTYAQGVEAKWLYGPKNSITVVLGVSDNGTIGWARAVTFSRVSDLKVHLRDALQGKTLSDDVPALIRPLIASEFKRTPMAQMEYLARAATPSTGWLVGLYILGLVLSIGLTVYMAENDVFGDESFERYRRRTTERDSFEVLDDDDDFKIPRW